MEREPKENMNTVTVVESEIEEVKKQHAERWKIYYFNNFHSKMPGGYIRLYPNLDDPYQNTGKTFREFFADVDKAIQELGVEIDTKKLHEDITKGDGEIAKKLMIKLREIGYQRGDLTV